jgi:hypothetical protein
VLTGWQVILLECGALAGSAQLFCVFKILSREETIHAISAVRKHKNNSEKSAVS